MAASGQRRVDAIPAAMTRRNEFMQRVDQASGDAVRCADLMAEAIQMHYDSNGVEVVGRDGRSFAGIEDMVSSHCLIAAKDAYLKARGSNRP